MQRVVGAALVRDGRVLAARRTQPAAVAGRWEFPGGKVEDGETADAALVREIAEELGVPIEVRHWLRGSVPIGASYELVVAVAVISSGEPQPVEHDEIRWLSAPELDDVDWLDPDRPFLPELRAALRWADGRPGP